ncbi:hypothetical protein DESC_240088 [Desulfosarcina cetonica]|nr:hypothetical protein DESC_240088 [Desulfosarcina cetonica]
MEIIQGEKITGYHSPSGQFLLGCAVNCHDRIRGTGCSIKVRLDSLIAPVFEIFSFFYEKERNEER